MRLLTADFPTTNWPPHVTAVVVAKIAPTRGVLARMKVTNEARPASISKAQ